MPTIAALLTNNATSSLAAGISSGATSLTVASGEGAKFPNPGASEYFYATLSTPTGSTIEIVKVTARSTDTFTIVRAQDGTSASAFSLGDIVELRVVAALFREKATGPASSTDNALARYDLTTGNALQDSAVTLDDTGVFTIPEAAVPASPAADKIAFYALDVSGVTRIGYKTSAGLTYVVAPDDIFTAAVRGLVPASGGGTTTFLRADGSFAIPITDSDKGDITVSGSGATWTIDAQAVTFAKFQNISTDRLLGRDTAGAGSVEELTVGGGIEFTGTGIQTSAFTGDVTKAAGGTALTHAANSVLNSILRDSGALSVIGRSANSAGDPADISAVAASDAVLRESGSVVGFGTIATGGIANDAVTFAKMQNVTTDRLLGRDTAASGDIEELSLNATLEFTGSGSIQRAALTGDVTASAGSNATTIANNAVTYAKMQDVSATDRVIGRATAGAGDPEEIVFTSFARSLADDSDAATARATLGLALGSQAQAWDADLDALAALATTGIAVRTAANTWAVRSLTQPAAGLTISNNDGVAGNPTFALGNDLAALEGLGSTGIAVRTGADAWAQRSIAGTAGKIVLTNGDGVSGNPTVNVGADIVDETIANTYTAGMKQTFQHSATTAGLNIAPATGDPSAPADGDIWYNSSTGVFRKRQGGSTSNLDTSGAGGLTIETVEVDFGSTPASSRTFDVALGGALTSQKVLCSVSLNMPTGVDVDEVEADPLTCAAYVPTNGTVRVNVATVNGAAITGKRNINLVLA